MTVASQLAFNSGGNNCAYIATKGAIVSFTKTTAVDYAKDGVRINTVAPAVIDTPMSRGTAANAADPEAMLQVASRKTSNGPYWPAGRSCARDLLPRQRRGQLRDGDGSLRRRRLDGSLRAFRKTQE